MVYLHIEIVYASIFVKYCFQQVIIYEKSERIDEIELWVMIGITTVVPLLGDL